MNQREADEARALEILKWAKDEELVPRHTDRHKSKFVNGLPKKLEIELRCERNGQNGHPDDRTAVRILIANGSETVTPCKHCGTVMEIPNALRTALGAPVSTCSPESISEDPCGAPVAVEALLTPDQDQPAGGREPGADDEEVLESGNASSCGIESETASPPPAAAKEPAAPAKSPNFKRKLLRELAKIHPGTTPMWIRDYFPAKSIIVIFGDPGSGKTTIVVDVVASIDMGLDWCGKRVSKGKVWYIAAEDPYGVRLRFEAWYQSNNLNFEEDTDIEIIEEPVCFGRPEIVDKLIADIKNATNKPDLIVLDTLSDTADGFNFNNEMGLFMTGFERFRNETECSVIIVAHTGHAAKERPKYGSELLSKADVIMPVKCEEDITTLSCTKMKNASKQDAKPVSWTMKKVDTKWLNAYGEVITSVVLEPTDKTIERITKAEKIALEALRDALIKHGTEDAGVVSVSESDWRQASYDLGISNGQQDAKQKAFSRAHVRLLALGKVKHHAGRYWIPPNRTNRTKPDNSEMSG